MGSKKGGGKARTPVVHKNTLFSKQLVKFMDVISEGEIAGFANGDAHPFKSVYFNDTPVQNTDGSFNFNGVEAFYNVGEPDQSYLPGFEATEKTVQVGVEVKRDAPVTRTVTDPLVSSIRATVGVKSLMEAKDNGDRVKTRVDIQVAIIKDGVFHDSKLISIYEKGTAGYYQDAIFRNVPEAPFNIEVRRLTPDSTSENLQNDTNFASYVEIIDAKLSLPNLATAGYRIDSSMFGQSLPRINHLIKGIVCLIPTNYDPINRTYSGVWDGSFKRGWTDNPAWILYTLATNKRYGAGINPRYIDIASLYRVSRFCDELVDDGFGGKEPRVTFNAYYTDEKKSSERRQEIASSFFGLAIWDGKYLTATIDDDTDPTALYTNHNVKGGEFAYEEVGADAVITTVHVQYHDKRDAYRQKIEVVEDLELVKRFRTNIKRVVAEGCTSRSQAQRYGRYILEKSRQKMTVSFTVGREGLRHSPWDIIQIADNHYAGAVIGGRVLEVEGNTVTLDLEVESAKGGTFTYIGEKDGRLQTIETEILSQKDERTLVLKEKTADLKRMTTWSLTRKDVKPKYYRALSIVDNKDGTYSIKAIEHEWGLHDRIAKGIRYENEKDSIWTSYPTISNPNLGNEGGDVIISWDSINDPTTSLTYSVKLYRDGKIYRTYENLAEPVFRFDSLPDGEYVAEVRAKNARGQLSNTLEMRFSINYKITELTAKSEYFGISLSWKLPEIVNKSISTEIWRAELDDIDKARRIVTLPYPTDKYINSGLAVTDGFYYWARVVDNSGTTGKFTPSVFGEVSTDAGGLLEMLDGQISDKQISKELQDQFDTNIEEKIEEAKIEIGSELEAIDVDLTGINSEIDNIKLDVTDAKSGVQSAQKSADSALKSAKENAEKIKNNSEVIEEVKLENEHSKALFQLAQMSDMSAQHSNYARSMSMSGQVANNSARIEDIDSFVINEKEATASRFKEMNTRVDNAESTITSVKETLSSDIEAEASKREELKAEFDINEAKQLLSTSTHSNAERSIAQRLSSVSASTANAHASIDELENVVAEQDRAQTERMTQMQSEVNSNKSSIESVSKTVADNEKAQASKNDEFTAEFDTHSAKNLLSLQSQASGNFSLSQRYSLLSAQHANSVAKLEQLQKVFADSETSWAVTEQRLQSQIDSSVSEIARIEKVSNERDKSQALQNELFTAEFDLSSAKLGLSNQSSASSEYSLSQRYSLLSAQHANSASKIERLEKAVADGEIAWSVSEERLQSEINSSKSEISRLDKTIAENDKAQSTAISNLTSKVSKAEADIASVKSTQANDKQALTEQINSANSKINSHSASITEIRKTQADTAGKVSTMWTMKVDGNGVIGGIMLGSDGHESMLKFAADNFIISTGDQSRNLFTIQRVNNRQVAALNVNDFILPGSLSADVIRANTKLSSPIIEGGRLSGGTITGGSLNIGNGACTIQSNGDFYARNGRFEGTVYAEKLVGDVVQILDSPIASDGSSRIHIPAANFARKVTAIGMTVRSITETQAGGALGQRPDSIEQSAEITSSTGHKAIANNRSFTALMEDRTYLHFATEKPLDFSFILPKGTSTNINLSQWSFNRTVGRPIRGNVLQSNRMWLMVNKV